jgi:hypothetical protein
MSRHVVQVFQGYHCITVTREVNEQLETALNFETFDAARAVFAAGEVRRLIDILDPAPVLEVQLRYLYGEGGQSATIVTHGKLAEPEPEPAANEKKPRKPRKPRAPKEIPPADRGAGSAQQRAFA